MERADKIDLLAQLGLQEKESSTLEDVETDGEDCLTEAQGSSSLQEVNGGQDESDDSCLDFLPQVTGSGQHQRQLYSESDDLSDESEDDVLNQLREWVAHLPQARSVKEIMADVGGSDYEESSGEEGIPTPPPARKLRAR